MKDAAVRSLRYRAYDGVRHDAFWSYVPRTLTFAYPPHRFGKDAQLNRMNFAVGTAHAARSDKVAGFDVIETPLLNPINLRIG